MAKIAPLLPPQNRRWRAIF